jgi:hypothetical protein
MMRTDATRQMRWWDNALYIVLEIVERLSWRLRTLSGGANLMTLVLERHNFRDVTLQREKMPELIGAGS